MPTSRQIACVLLLSVSLIPTSMLFGFSSGVFPGQNNVPKDVTSALPGCGNPSCHSSFPNSRPEAGPVVLAINTTTSFQVGSTITVNLSVTGGLKSPRAGFAVTSDKGTFIAGANTQVSGSNATHKDSLSRAWSVGFTHNQPGLVRWTAAVNTVNGNGRADPNDNWGFYGPSSYYPGSFFYLFVNDSQVFAFGSPCQGSDGYSPVAGIAKNAAIGQSHTLEVHAIPPGVVTLGILGLSNKTWGPIPLPLPLAGLGAQGCDLRVSYDIVQAGIAAGTGKGNGSVSFTWTLPNLTILRGLDLYEQAIVFDKGANSGGLTTSAGLRARIQ